MKIIFASLLMFFFMNASMPSKYYFVVGTYTKNSKESVHWASFDPNLKKIEMLSHSDFIESPTFMTLNKNNSMLYVTSESEGGELYALDVKGRTLKIVNKQPSGGAHPCHVMLDKTEKWAFVGNYTGGSLSVYPILKNGELGAPVQTIQQVGKGPKTQQEKAHVHSVNISADNKNLLVTDLGTDHIINYAFDIKTGKLKEKQRISVSSGSGPRHLVFHPTLPFVYVIQELDGKVSQLEWKNNTLKLISEVSSLPADFSGTNFSADIHFSGDAKFLYASNRYYDTIVRFLVDPKTGALKQLEQTPTKGKIPRNFGITPDGKYMLVANQGTDNIVVFRLENGKMIDMNIEGAVSMPVCIKFLN